MPIDDEEQLARVEKGIRDGQRRITKLIKTIERLHSAGRDITVFKEVLETLRASQATHLQHRELLLREIKSLPLTGELLEQSRVAVAETKRLLEAGKQDRRINFDLI